MGKTIQWTQKYRPKSLTEYIGNKSMKIQLNTLIESGKVPQTMMFYGEKGTGKTTIARLVVKNLSCETPKKGEACGECSNCKRLDDTYITTGVAPRQMYVKELNIADLRGVADAELIVQDMQKSVGFGRKRIFILDEMQQASKEAQSAFLKIMEEPIPNLYVIMCTTHPDKITEALASRFKRFRIKRPMVGEIAERLQKIAQQEGVNYDMHALRIIANHHKNNPRESINQLETLAVTTENNLTVKNIEEQLEKLPRRMFESFLESCKSGNLNNLVVQMENLENEGTETEEFVSGLGDYVVDLLKIRSGVKLDLYTVEQIKDMRKFVKMFTEADIVNVLKVLKEYSSVRNMDFHLYGLAVEIMDGLKVEEEIKEIPENTTRKLFNENTKKVIEHKGKDTRIEIADEEYLNNVIPKADKIIGMPGKKE